MFTTHKHIALYKIPLDALYQTSLSTHSTFWANSSFQHDSSNTSWCAKSGQNSKLFLEGKSWKWIILQYHPSAEFGRCIKRIKMFHCTYQPLLIQLSNWLNLFIVGKIVRSWIIQFFPNSPLQSYNWILREFNLEILYIARKIERIFFNEVEHFTDKKFYRTM